MSKSLYCMKHASDVRNSTWITFDHLELKCVRRFKIILINYSYLYIVGKVYVNNSLCLQFYTTFYNSLLFHTNYMFSILIPILISVLFKILLIKDIFSIVIWFYFIFTILNPKKSWILKMWSVHGGIAASDIGIVLSCGLVTSWPSAKFSCKLYPFLILNKN